MTNHTTPTTHRVGAIVADHYRTEEARIAATPAARAMLDTLPADIVEALAADRFVPDLMGMANREYARLSGDHGAHLGAVVGALTLLARARLVVADRAESDPCQRGTDGCCVDHAACDHECETW